MDPETPTQEQEYVKPDPANNPRNQVLAEIAKSAAANHAAEDKETFPSIDDEGNISPAPSAPPAQAPVEDAAPSGEAEAPAVESTPAEAAQGEHPAEEEEELVVEGQKVRFPKSKIIEAGRRTIQKETAADQRLKLASELLEEAEARVRAVPTAPQQPAPPPANFAELARTIQFGTPEEAAAALQSLAGNPPVSPEEIVRVAEQRARQATRDEQAFQDAMKFVQTEYGDLLSNDYVRRLFFTEEQRARAPKEKGGLGDTRPYKELYASIGETLRKELKMPKVAPASTGAPATTPPGSAAARQERKAAAPSVPRTAASRLAESSAAQKAPTPSEIIAGMAASRGKNRLTEPRKGA